MPETTLFPSIRVVTEVPHSSRLGSQAQHAPPALTFGGPGKQNVKGTESRGILPRILKTLAGLLQPGVKEAWRLGAGGVRSQIDRRRKAEACSPGEARRTPRPASQSALPSPHCAALQAGYAKFDLPVQKLHKANPLRVQRLGIERGLGQPGQRIGFEVDQAIGRHDEIRA